MKRVIVYNGYVYEASGEYNIALYVTDRVMDYLENLETNKLISGQYTRAGNRIFTIDLVDIFSKDLLEKFKKQAPSIYTVINKTTLVLDQGEELGGDLGKIETITINGYNYNKIRSGAFSASRDSNERDSIYIHILDENGKIIPDSEEHLRSVLLHELTHSYDYRINNVNFKDEHHKEYLERNYEKKAHFNQLQLAIQKDITNWIEDIKEDRDSKDIFSYKIQRNILISILETDVEDFTGKVLRGELGKDARMILDRILGSVSHEEVFSKIGEIKNDIKKSLRNVLPEKKFESK